VAPVSPAAPVSPKAPSTPDAPKAPAAPSAPKAPSSPAAPTADCERIERFDLWNGETDTLNRTNVLNGTVLCREDFRFSIQAVVALNNCVDNVRFTLRGPDYDYSNTERTAPYFLFTNQGPEIEGRSLSPGNYTLVASSTSVFTRKVVSTSLFMTFNVPIFSEKSLSFTVKRCRA
jgi:hypothetical protein